jgi:hypothetical protein
MKKQLYIAKSSWSFYRTIKKTSLTENLILMAGIGGLNAQYRANIDGSSDGTSASTYEFTSLPLSGINLTGVMKYFSSIFLFLLLIFQNNVYSQGFRWSTSGGIVGGTGSNSTGSFDIARDVNGNLFAFSNTTGNQQCQGDTVEHIGSTVLANGFIYKFNENGELIWLKAVGPEFFPYAIEADGAGNSYVLGKTGTPSTLSTIDTTIDINGSYNIIKFNPDGELQWVHNTGMPLTGGNNRTSLLKVVQDRIYFQGGSTKLSCIDTAGVFITDLNATFYDPTTAPTNIWFKNADLFSNGDILLCGEHQGRLGFDQDTLPLSENDAALNRLFYLRCTPDLEVVWFRSYGSFKSSAAYPTGLVIDDFGDIYTSVLLSFSTPVVFGEDSIFNDDLINGIGAITRMNSNGEAIWMRAFESSVSPAMGGLTTSSEQSGVWFCGTHPGTITIGDTTLNGAQTSKGFIAHIDNSGQITRAFSYGTPASIQNFPQALTKNGEGEYYVCGFLSGSGSYELSCQNFPSNFGIAISAFNGEPDQVPTPQIITTGTLLTAEPEFFGDIQWFLDGEEIPEANSQTFEASEEGNYSVVYSYAFGCEGEAASEVVLVTTGLDNVKSKEFMIYPNPAKEFVYLTGTIQHADFILINSLGATVMQGKIGNENSINTTELKAGIYYLVLSENGLSDRFIIVD